MNKVTSYFTLCFQTYVFCLLCSLHHLVVLDSGWKPYPEVWCLIPARQHLQASTSTVYSKCCPNASLDWQPQGGAMCDWTSGSYVHVPIVTCPLLQSGSWFEMILCSVMSYWTLCNFTEALWVGKANLYLKFVVIPVKVNHCPVQDQRGTM